MIYVLFFKFTDGKSSLRFWEGELYLLDPGAPNPWTIQKNRYGDPIRQGTESDARVQRPKELLYVNRQIYAKSRHIFFSENEFSFQPDLSVPSTCILPDEMFPKTAPFRLIRHFSVIMDLSIYDNSCYARENVLWKYIAEMKSLETIWVSIAE